MARDKIELADNATLVPYESRRGKGKGRKRWRVISTGNGEKVSMSSEGYVRATDLRRSVELTLEACRDWLRRNKR